MLTQREYSQQRLDSCRETLEGGDRRVLPTLFQLAASEFEEIRTQAAKLLSLLLARLTFDQTVRAEAQIRQATLQLWARDWRRFDPETVFTQGMDERDRGAVVAFSSFHPNGYLREKAVRLLAGYPGMLPYALLRVNDWVPQVRDAAEETADFRLGHLACGELVASLAYADKLSRAGRTGMGLRYLTRIRTALAKPEREGELKAGLTDSNLRTRRFCVQALFNAESPRYDLADSCLETEKDPFLRAEIFRRLQAAGRPMDRAAENFLRDRYYANRATAFRYLLGSGGPDRGIETARKFLLDPSAIVRGLARTFLEKNRAGFDAAAFYRGRIAGEDTPAAVICGLGETGKPGDAPMLEPFLASERISAVRASMVALMRLDGAKYVPAVTEFLRDDRPGIVGTACSLLLRADPDLDRVWEILQESPANGKKIKCFRILLRAGRWRRLRYILDVLDGARGDLADRAMVELERWIEGFNRGYTAPLEESERKQILDRIGKLESRIPAKTLRKLRFSLR